MSTVRSPAQVAADRRYRKTARARELDAAKKRRKRARHPREAATRVVLLQAHSKRVRAIARNRLAKNEPMLPGPSVEDTRQVELKRLAGLLRTAEADRTREGRDEVERLRRQMSLLAGPLKKRPGVGLVGLTLGTTALDPIEPFTLDLENF